jgi:hypothetical protein
MPSNSNCGPLGRQGVYAVLVDITDAVAEELQLPFAAISMEMVYRGLFHFTSVYADGKATDVICQITCNCSACLLMQRSQLTSRSIRFYAFPPPAASNGVTLIVMSCEVIPENVPE